MFENTVMNLRTEFCESYKFLIFRYGNPFKLKLNSAQPSLNCLSCLLSEFAKIYNNFIFIAFDDVWEIRNSFCDFFFVLAFNLLQLLQAKIKKNTFGAFWHENGRKSFLTFCSVWFLFLFCILLIDRFIENIICVNVCQLLWMDLWFSPAGDNRGIHCECEAVHISCVNGSKDYLIWYSKNV